jgi:hypothetical protein
VDWSRAFIFNDSTVQIENRPGENDIADKQKANADERPAHPSQTSDSHTFQSISRPGNAGLLNGQLSASQLFTVLLAREIQRILSLTVHGFGEFSLCCHEIGFRGVGTRLDLSHFSQSGLDICLRQPFDNNAGFAGIVTDHRRTITVQNRDAMFAKVAKGPGRTIA